MKKNIFFVFLVLFSALSFIDCKSQLGDFKSENTESPYVEISFTCGSSVDNSFPSSRNAVSEKVFVPESLSEKIKSFKIIGDRENNLDGDTNDYSNISEDFLSISHTLTKVEGKTWNEIFSEYKPTVLRGKWTFTLNAYFDDTDSTVYYYDTTQTDITDCDFRVSFFLQINSSLSTNDRKGTLSVDDIPLNVKSAECCMVFILKRNENFGGSTGFERLINLSGTDIKIPAFTKSLDPDEYYLLQVCFYNLNDEEIFRYTAPFRILTALTTSITGVTITDTDNFTLTLNANFDASSSYKPKYGTQDFTIAENVFTKNSRITLPVLTRDYYEFNGWNENENANANANGSGMNWKVYEHSLDNNDDVTLYASYTAKEYGINYVLEGGIIPPEQIAGETYDKSYTVEDEEVRLPTPEKEHYDFYRWELPSTGDCFTTTVTPWDLNNGLSPSLQERTLNAQWTPLEYTITFDSNGGSVENPINYTVETSLPLPTNLTKEHYTFAGWYEASDYSGNAITTTENLGGDKTLYAKWVPVPYTINYDYDGGFLQSGETYDTTYTVETSNVILPKPVKTHYTQTGWKVDGAGEPVASVTPSQLGYKNITLEAQWDYAVYTIEYYTKHGALSEYDSNKIEGEYNVYTKGYPYNILSNNTFTLPSLSEPGWTFEGWATSSDSSSSIISNVIQGWIDSWSGTKKLYARWTQTGIVNGITVTVPDYTPNTEAVTITATDTYHNTPLDLNSVIAITNDFMIQFNAVGVTFNTDSIVWYNDVGPIAYGATTYSVDTTSLSAGIHKVKFEATGTDGTLYEKSITLRISK